jgi:hypothetical protein
VGGRIASVAGRSSSVARRVTKVTKRFAKLEIGSATKKSDRREKSTPAASRSGSLTQGT